MNRVKEIETQICVSPCPKGKRFPCNNHSWVNFDKARHLMFVYQEMIKNYLDVESLGGECNRAIDLKFIFRHWN